MTGLHGQLHGLDQAIGGGGGGAPSFAGGGADGLTIWEWDGTTGQFDGADAYSTSPISSVLTAVADATRPKGALLRWENHQNGLAAGTQTLAVRLVTDPLPAATYRFRWEMEIADLNTDVNTGAAYVGMVAFADVDGGGDLFGYAWLTGTAEYAWRFDGGVQVGNGNNLNSLPLPIAGTVDSDGSPLFGRFIMDIYGNKVVGDVPVFQYYLQGECRAVGGTATNRPRNAGRQTSFTQYGVLPAAPATWNPLTCLRFGIVVAQPNQPFADVTNDVYFAGLRIVAI